MDMAAVNASILFCKVRSDGCKAYRGRGDKREPDARRFILLAAKGLIELGRGENPAILWAKSKFVTRLNRAVGAFHLPVVLPSGDVRRRCSVCARKSSVRCQQCNLFFRKSPRVRVQALCRSEDEQPQRSEVFGESVPYYT